MFLDGTGLETARAHPHRRRRRAVPPRAAQCLPAARLRRLSRGFPRGGGGRDARCGPALCRGGPADARRVRPGRGARSARAGATGAGGRAHRLRDDRDRGRGHPARRHQLSEQASRRGRDRGGAAREAAAADERRAIARPAGVGVPEPHPRRLQRQHLRGCAAFEDASAHAAAEAAEASAQGVESRRRLGGYALDCTRHERVWAGVVRKRGHASWQDPARRVIPRPLMIQVQDVTKAFAGKKLFESVSTTFPPGRRYGLTGPNGAGKSTFMQILAGGMGPGHGGVSRPQRLSLPRLMKEMAGGNKVRVLLAQALFGKPTALLLDEPTNSLDLDSIHWLEDFLLQYEGTLVVISHDRYFLNAICTHIADIDYETIITYGGNYDEMVRAKGQVRSRIEAENADKMKKRAQLQEFVARFSAGTRASQVQSRIKQLEKLSVTDLKKSNIARPFIKLEQKRPSGKQTLTIEGLTKGFDRPLFTDFSALITKGERVAVVGRNGVGKTTLLRSLIGELEPDAGKVTWGHEAQIGYMPQDVKPIIPVNTTCFDYLHDIDPSAGNEEIRGLLGRMLFRGDEGMKPTKALSGGEAVRLLFCKLMLGKPNVLVLDEPTNHLDLESISALGDGLSSYPGTVIFVAHDRDLIDTV